jgi:mannose-6-phosphate isomerase
MLYPLRFKPIFQERIWGGRNLSTLYKKNLPRDIPVGESWEISDRPEAQSEIVNGPFAGRTLHWLLQHHREPLLGSARALHGRFPLLVKILDAQEKLSLQVHPPASRAQDLGGEPKTEIWYITHAEPRAELFVGLKRGVTRDIFQKKIQDGSVADSFHRIKVRTGDAMFLPSGRVHAIGGGMVIFEIQQNSDTTYRVFDWNRRDSSGKARQLHVQESLECIDFDDYEPALIRGERDQSTGASFHIQTLVEDPLFSVEVVTSSVAGHMEYEAGVARVIGVVKGELRVAHPEHSLALQSGEFCLLPAALSVAKLESCGPAKFLVAKPGS